MGFCQTTDFTELNDRMWQQVFNNPDSAIIMGKSIIVLAKEEKNDKALAKSYAQIGVAFDLKGMPDSALPYFHKAIKIQETNKDSVGLSFSYNNLGLMYYAQYNYPSALKNLRKSLKIDESINDIESAAGSLINIGIILTYIDSLDESVRLYQKAADFYQKVDNQQGIVTALSNMAKVHYAKKNYQKALENNLKVEAFYKKNGGHPEALSSCYNSLANTYLKMNQFNLALDYANKDLIVCEEGQLTNKKQFAYETLNEVYTAQGNYEKAHAYLKKYTVLRDSILNENRTAVIEEMQTKYETEKTEKELTEIRLEKETQVLKHQKEKQFFYAAIILFILLALILLMGYRSKQKINGLLKDKNQLNEAIIEQKEILLGEVHHRVKNNLQLINSIVELQAIDLQNDKAADVLVDIQKRINAIAELHQFLYQGEDVEKVEVNQYLNSLVEGLKRSFKQNQKTVKINTNIIKLDLDVKTAVPLGLIVNEMVTNSLKYAFKEIDKPEIKIKLFKNKNQLILIVNDNGIGINENDKKSVSFGMKMVKSLCRQLKAKMQIESNNGTKHTFTIERFKIYE